MGERTGLGLGKKTEYILSRKLEMWLQIKSEWDLVGIIDIDTIDKR
jgi:hypothetical protein